MLLPINGFTQTEENYSAWYALILNYRINDKFNLKNEVHIRRTNFHEDWQQLTLRPSLNYQPNNVVEVTFGLTHSKNFNPVLNFNEDNLWEQLTFHQRWGISAFRHRFRLEQRLIHQTVFMEDGIFATDGTDYQGRVRYKFSWFVPVIKISDNKKMVINVSEELGMNIFTGIVPKYLNFNRIHLGLIYQILHKLLLEMGYDDSYSPRGASNFSRNHVLQTTLTYQIR